MLDKNTCKKTHHVRRVQKDIRLVERHTLINGSREMLNPHPILAAHMLFFAAFLLLTRE